MRYVFDIMQWRHMSTVASQITGQFIQQVVHSWQQRNHQMSASLDVCGNAHRLCILCFDEVIHYTLVHFTYSFRATSLVLDGVVWLKQCPWSGSQWYGKYILQWRHNERNGVSNHRRPGCLLNHLLRCRSKKTSKLRVTELCERNPLVDFPHKGPVTRKMFPFDNVIMRPIFTTTVCIFIGMHYHPKILTHQLGCFLSQLNTCSRCDMETFSAQLVLCKVNPTVTDGSPTKEIRE